MDGDQFPNDEDICPASIVPGRHLDWYYYPNYFRDTDADGTPDDCDRCPLDSDNDLDGDGICGEHDNCPRAANPLQEDANGDGSGEACQPFVILNGIRQDGGDTLEVSAVAGDPDGDPLSGAIEFFGSTASTQSLRNVADVFDCGAGFSPDGQPGGIVYYKDPYGPYLVDLDSSSSFFGAPCDDGLPDFWLAPTTCAQSENSSFQPVLALEGLALPADACLRRAETFSGGFDLRILEFSDQELVVSVTSAQLVLHIPFSPSLPRLTDISSLTAGTQYTLRITATDGTTPPALAQGSFLHQGEATMLIGGGAPRAVIAPHGAAECDRPQGGQVVLDGSASEDGGFGEALVSYDWYEDYGQPEERVLGSGAVLGVTLPLGAREVTLVVTDAGGATGMATSSFVVADTVPPTLSLALNPSILWPPNHRLVPVQVAWIASDACDPSPSVSLESVASSEPDDAAGGDDGATTGDVASALAGSPDAQVLLRAERSGSGGGRTYTLVYVATDASGTSTHASALASVPHDQGGGPEPLSLWLERGGGAGSVSVSWNDVPGASSYDLIVGQIENLAFSGNHIRHGQVQVLAQETSLTSWMEPVPFATPERGKAYFYLVQYHDASGSSGFGSVSAGVPHEDSP